MTRSRAAYLANASSAEKDSVALKNFSRQLLKGGEHTWGTDTQYGATTLPNDVWSNGALGRARRNETAAVELGPAPCLGLNQSRPKPPCPQNWWGSGSLCFQGCPLAAQGRDPSTARCLCGASSPNSSCLAGLQCISRECVDCTPRPAQVNPFPLIESRWREQRQWAVHHTLEALGDHPLRTAIDSEIAALRPTVPALKDYTRLAPADATERVFSCGDFNVSFSGSGAISHLTRLSSGHEWASRTQQLLEPLYQSLSFDDFSAFYSSYLNMAEHCTPTSAGFPCGSCE